MTMNKKLSRRDFLKIGGLSAVSLPVIKKVVQNGKQSFFESPENYGGFLVRSSAKADPPPYDVDDEIYQRYDAKNSILSRAIWDEPFADRIASAEKIFTNTDPGYEQMNSALMYAAMLVQMHGDTNCMFIGSHNGLLALNHPMLVAPFGPVYDTKWDHSHKSPEDMAAMVKKAGLFLGASLVGVAPLDERWVYSGYYDMLEVSGAPIDFTEVEIPELPEGQLSPKEAGDILVEEFSKLPAEEIKDIVTEVMSNFDQSQLPSDAPPISIFQLLPASQFKEKVYMFGEMPTPILRAFAARVNLDLEIADIDLGESAKPRYLDDKTLAIPETMKTVIVLAFEMDYDSMETAPALLSDASTMDGYSKMAATAGSLAVFIRELGYHAIPCGNNTALSVPMAIDAGLGELGRNGILITPKYGPRVRLAKVITDMPMAYDSPISFGVKEFCDICKKCATTCPTNAISDGPQTREPTTFSSNPGVMKWPVDAEQCYLGWNIQGSSCSTCIRVCPFNKPEGWLHDATRVLIGAKSGSIDNIMVKLDNASGYGRSEPNLNFWEKENYIHIKK